MANISVEIVNICQPLSCQLIVSLSCHFITPVSHWIPPQVAVLSRYFLCCFQNGLFRHAGRPILQRETNRFTSQNGPSGVAKVAVLYGHVVLSCLMAGLVAGLLWNGKALTALRSGLDGVL